MISGRQIRAARALLEWGAEDLARKAGLTRVTISKIETDLVQPQEKTLTQILAVFDKNGVEFLDDEGVRMRKQQLRIYSGKAGYRQLLDHIYDTLKSGGRIRQFNYSEGKDLPYADDFVTAHMKRMATIKNLDARVLAVEGGHKELLSYCSYRYMDKSLKIMAPYYLYGDYLVLSLYETGHKREFTTIHSKLLAERYAQEFDFFWNNASAAKGKKKK